MEGQQPDVASRGRALFDRLRSLQGAGKDQEATDPEAAPADEAPADDASDPPAPTAAPPVPAEEGDTDTGTSDDDAASLGEPSPVPSGPEVSDDTGEGEGGETAEGGGAERSATPDAPEPGQPSTSGMPDDGRSADGATAAVASTADALASSAVAEEVHAPHPASELPLPRILAVANQKGGVGKTTTAVNLGAALAELGYRTLVIDLDPQGNATTGLGINARNLEHSVYDVLMHELALDECIEPTNVRNLFVAPATIDLAGAEIELVPAFSRELRLRRALAETEDSYDFTVIDCPPSLGLLTINGLAAATEVVVPIQCEYYALEGLSQLMQNVSLVQSNLNPPLALSAIILTMYDARTKLADQVATEVRSHFGPKVCRNVVPRTVRLSEAPSFGQPITVFDSTSRGALAYRELAKEVSGGAPQRTG
ncbi:MAG: ParA family protein [Acidimicrobiales bacterium]